MKEKAILIVLVIVSAVFIGYQLVKLFERRL